MKRDKEWLINELTKMNSVDNENQYVFGYETAIDLALDLADQLEEPGKVVIPQFVADWWERDGDSVTLYGWLRVEKKYKFHLISKFYDKGLGDYLSKVEEWADENDSIFLELVNGKPYEVEKEKLYYVKLPTAVWNDEASELEDSSFYLKLNITSEEIAFSNLSRKVGDWSGALTEKQIKNFDPRYWPFAEPVEVES